MSGAPKNGLCSVTFRGLAVNDIVTMARDSGLDCIEWGGDVHAKPSLGIDALRAIGAATRAAGMTVSSYGTYHRLGASDPAELPEILACAKALGAPVVRVWAGDRGSSEASPEWRAAVHAAARKAAEAAAREGLRISLECHINTLTDDPEEALSLLSEGPEESFGMHWQPNQFHDEAWNLEYAGAVSARVNAVHVFNWSLSAEEKVVRHPLSDGIPAWRRYLALLPAAAPRLLEFVPGDDPAVLRREAAALEALRRPWTNIEPNKKTTMKISWQGNLTETNAATVAEFLEREGVDASGAVVEWNERMFAPGDDLRGVALEDGGTLSAFKVVAGG